MEWICLTRQTKSVQRMDGIGNDHCTRHEPERGQMLVAIAPAHDHDTVFPLRRDRPPFLERLRRHPGQKRRAFANGPLPMPFFPGHGVGDSELRRRSLRGQLTLKVAQLSPRFRGNHGSQRGNGQAFSALTLF